MTVAHATLTDLTAWLPVDVDLGDDPERLLARASTLVDLHVRASYAVTTTGAPSDATISAALRDATCAVVEAWTETGEENDLDGLAGTQMSVPGYSGHRAVTLPPRAHRVLAQAGLTQLSDTGPDW